MELPVNTFEALLTQIKICLEKESPFFINVQSKNLFYINEIKREDAERILIISGYDEEKKTVCIQDYKIIDRKINPELVGERAKDPLYRMTITVEMLKKIWNEEERTQKIGYTIQENEEKKNLNYVLETARRYIEEGNDRLVETLISDKVVDVKLIPGERRHFVHAYFIIFDFISRYVLENPNHLNLFSEEWKGCFMKLMQEVLDTRSKVVGYFHKEHIKKAYSQTSEQTKRLVLILKEQNKKMEELIKEILEIEK